MRRAAVAMALMAAGPLGAQTLTVPGPAGPLEGQAIAVPGAAHAVVIVPGSGPTDRDGNSAATGLRSDAYRLLAEGLAAAGVASIRIDKRGFGGSARAVADPNTVTIADYAEDVAAWVEVGRALAPCVWVGGHSEGAVVALVAAGQGVEGLCGLVLLTPPGRPLGTILLDQLRANPGVAPFMDELERIVRGLEDGALTEPAAMSEPLRPFLPVDLQRFMVDLFGYDPAATAAAWEGPALIVSATADLQLSAEDADILARAMPQARTLVLDGATHVLKTDVPGAPLATYTDPAIPLHPDLVPGIVAFLEETAP